jgi:hypothetical protein
MADATAHATDRTTDRRHHDQTVGIEDVTGVRSRVSWPAILAGSATALSLYFLLTLFGGAIGLSVRDAADPRTIGIGAGVYAIIATALCLFAGGWVASQLTAGENTREATLYGLFVWAVVFALMMFLVAGGVRAGYAALVGTATITDVASRQVSQEDVESGLRRAGYTSEQVNEYRERLRNAPATAQATAEDPAARQQAADTATRVTWWAFAGAMLSMAAAAAGGYVGAGPSFRLFAVPVGRASVGTYPTR